MATYSEIATLMNSSTFRDAVTVAVAKYAAYILAENATAVQNHNQRAAWAKSAYQSPGATSSGLLTAVALDPNVQAAIPTPNDATVQSATEAAVNTTMAF